jgi:hypothetical protein
MAKSETNKKLKSSSKVAREQKSIPAENKPFQPIVKEEESKEYYDTEGHPFKEEPNKCCAKKIHTENGTDMYYLKMTMSEVLYHPIKNKGEKHIHTRELGRPYWNFKKVKKPVFEAYMAFLRTKNELFFGNASRGLM